jgi:hypothetical protein
MGRAWALETTQTCVATSLSAAAFSDLGGQCFNDRRAEFMEKVAQMGCGPTRRTEV